MRTVEEEEKGRRMESIRRKGKRWGKWEEREENGGFKEKGRRSGGNGKKGRRKESITRNEKKIGRREWKEATKEKNEKRWNRKGEGKEWRL